MESHCPGSGGGVGKGGLDNVDSSVRLALEG